MIIRGRLMDELGNFIAFIVTVVPCFRLLIKRLIGRRFHWTVCGLRLLFLRRVVKRVSIKNRLLVPCWKVLRGRGRMGKLVNRWTTLNLIKIIVIIPKRLLTARRRKMARKSARWTFQLFVQSGWRGLRRLTLRWTRTRKWVLEKWLSRTTRRCRWTAHWTGYFR